MGNLAYQSDFTEKLREEMLNGKIVAMSPCPLVNHTVVAGNIYAIFKKLLKGKSCSAFPDGVDVFLTEKDRVIPDAMIVCDKNIVKRTGVFGVPDLIVEVLSPSTAKNDKGYKKNLYEKCGVKEYWIVEVETLSIEVYLLKENQFILDEVYRIFPDYLLENMTEEELNSTKHEFTVSLSPDMLIKLEEVFEGRF